MMAIRMPAPERAVSLQTTSFSGFRTGELVTRGLGQITEFRTFEVRYAYSTHIGTSTSRSASTRPLSVIFRLGITSSARKLIAMNGS